MTAQLIAWEIMCAALFWSVFCRCVRTDKTTKLQIRVALYLVGLGSLLGLGAPLYGWGPDWIILTIVSSIVIMQIVMAQHWGRGVPDRFTRNRFLNVNRRKEDRK